jgi:hypothetical protein
MAASMLLWSALATPLLDAIGAAATELLCGLAILAIGVAGYAVCRRLEDRERAGAADPAPVPGE